MLEVFNGSDFEAMNIRNLLESKNIDVFVMNEFMSNIKPWAISAGGFNPVVLKVDKGDFEKATKIIKDYNDGILDLDN